MKIKLKIGTLLEEKKYKIPVTTQNQSTPHLFKHLTENSSAFKEESQWLTVCEICFCL